MVPALAPFRPMLILALANVPIALFARMLAPEVGKLRTQAVMVFLFFGFTISALIPHRLYGANLRTLTELTPNVLAYFLGIVYFRTAGQLRRVRALLVFMALFVLLNGLMELPYAHAAGAETPYVMAHVNSLNVMDYRTRGLGILHDPNTYAQFLLLILPLLFVSKNDTGLGLQGWATALVL